MIKRWLLLGSSVFLMVTTASISSSNQQSSGTVTGLKRLDFLQGTWSGSQSLAGGPSVSRALTLLNCSRVLDGKWLQIACKPSQNGSPVPSSIYMLGYDAEAAMYSATWFSSDKAVAVDLAGNFNGDTLIMLSKPVTTTTGSVIYRATWAHPKSNQVTFVLEVQNEGKWTPLTEGHYNRSKS